MRVAGEARWNKNILLWEIIPAPLENPACKQGYFVVGQRRRGRMTLLPQLPWLPPPDAAGEVGFRLVARLVARDLVEARADDAAVAAVASHARGLGRDVLHRGEFTARRGRFAGCGRCWPRNPPRLRVCSSMLPCEPRA